MTPLGHAAVAYGISGCTRRLVWPALVLGGVACDVDFLLFWAPQFNAWHRVITHNLAFVVASAVLVAGLTPYRFWHASPLRVGVSFLLGGLSHLLVDSMLDGNPSNGIGVALWWPFSAQSWSPVNLVVMKPDPPTWDEPRRMAWSVLSGVRWELPFYALAVLIAWRRRP